MNKIADYMLVKEFDRYRLEQSVRILLKNGYVPSGAAFAALHGDGTTWLYQTMLKYKE